jgi:hypothetical protein
MRKMSICSKAFRNLRIAMSPLVTGASSSRSLPKTDNPRTKTLSQQPRYAPRRLHSLRTNGDLQVASLILQVPSSLFPFFVGRG